MEQNKKKTSINFDSFDDAHKALSMYVARHDNERLYELEEELDEKIREVAKELLLVFHRNNHSGMPLKGDEPVDSYIDNNIYKIGIPSVILQILEGHELESAIKAISGYLDDGLHCVHRFDSDPRLKIDVNETSNEKKVIIKPWKAD